MGKQASIAFQKDLYQAIKGDPATAAITLVGPSLGKTYGYDNGSPFGKGTLTASVDWGNFHPHPGGNPFSLPFGYAGIEKYIWHGGQPTTNIDEFPYASDIYAPPFAPKPMTATEPATRLSTAAPASAPTPATFRGCLPNTSAKASAGRIVMSLPMSSTSLRTARRISD